MPMADVYYNNTRSRKYNYGGNVQHISSFGPMRDVAPANFDRTAVRGFVSVTEKIWLGCRSFVQKSRLAFLWFSK